MEALKMDAFTEYAFLSALRCGPEGGVAFVAAKADVEENGYQRDLWVKPQEGEAFQLTTDGKTGGFLWDGPHTLLFQSGRDPQGKRPRRPGKSTPLFTAWMSGAARPKRLSACPCPPLWWTR